MHLKQSPLDKGIHFKVSSLDSHVGNVTIEASIVDLADCRAVEGSYIILCWCGLAGYSQLL